MVVLWIVPLITLTVIGLLGYIVYLYMSHFVWKSPMLLRDGREVVEKSRVEGRLSEAMGASEIIHVLEDRIAVLESRIEFKAGSREQMLEKFLWHVLDKYEDPDLAQVAEKLFGYPGALEDRPEDFT